MTRFAIGHLFLPVGLRLELEQDQAEVQESLANTTLNLIRGKKGGLEPYLSPTHRALYLKLTSHTMI